MASSEQSIICGTCNYKGEREAANKWCTNCDEGLCQECERHHRSSKPSRNHKIIFVEDYLKIQQLTTTLDCNVHSKSLELYCKGHDEAICTVCVPIMHKACTGIVHINEAAKTHESSHASDNLFETLKSALENVRKLHTYGNSAVASLGEEKSQILTKVKMFQDQIDIHLNNLRDKLKKQLDEKYLSCIEIYQSKLLEVADFEKRLENLYVSFKCLREHATDVQVLLSSKKIKEETETIVKSVQETMGNVVSFHLDIETEPVVNALLNSSNLAEIGLSKHVMSFPYKGFSFDQAQVNISGSDLYQTVSIIKTVDISIPDNKHIITGCTVLPSGKAVIADGRGLNKLLEFDCSGKFLRYLNLPAASSPWDVATLGQDHVVVSLPTNNSIVIIRTDVKEQRTVQFQGQCCGIACHDDNIYVVVRSVGIVEVAKTGKIMKSIKIAANLITNLTVSKDNLFYTNNEDNSINCCTTTGKLIWKFRDGALTKLFGISADNFGSVFVVNKEKHSVMLIKHDGTEIRTLINNDKEIERPTAVYFDHGKRQLLVCNETGRAAIYNVCI